MAIEPSIDELRAFYRQPRESPGPSPDERRAFYEQHGYTAVTSSTGDVLVEKRTVVADEAEAPSVVQALREMPPVYRIAGTADLALMTTVEFKVDGTTVVVVPTTRIVRVRVVDGAEVYEDAEIRDDEVELLYESAKQLEAQCCTARAEADAMKAKVAETQREIARIRKESADLRAETERVRRETERVSSQLRRCW